MWTHRTPPPSSEPWVRTTRIHLTHHPRSRDGSSTFQTETLGECLPEEEEGHHHGPQDHLPEVVEVVEAVEVVEVEEAVEAGEEHFHYLDTRLPNQLKNF